MTETPETTYTEAPESPKTTGAHAYLIVSDLHLSDIEQHADGWKAYKHPRYIFDEDFDQLVKRFSKRARNGEKKLTLILNGDIFDFDLVMAVPRKPPWKVRFKEKRRGLDATNEKSAWKLEQILRDHPRFVRTLAHFLSRGHSIVYVMGNHDREFHFPLVQDTLRQALHTAATTNGGDFSDSALMFEPWFFYVPGRLYVEHGQQYDYYTSFHYLLQPTIKKKGEEVIALPMGNLSNRYLVTRMGYFNPHASDYILNMFRYAAHWLKYYAFSTRSLVFSWFFGSIDVMRRLLHSKEQLRKKPTGYDELMDAVATKYNLPRPTVDNLKKQHRLPITTRFFRIIREFWLDRLTLFLLMAGGTVALAMGSIPLWIKLMVPLTGFPLLFFIYETAVQGESIFTVDHRMPKYARDVARILDVQLVTFGHIHMPRLIPLGKDVVFIDSGTWAPIMRHQDSPELADGYRNYITASFGNSRSTIEYHSWQPFSSRENSD